MIFAFVVLSFYAIGSMLVVLAIRSLDPAVAPTAAATSASDGASRPPQPSTARPQVDHRETADRHLDRAPVSVS